MVVRDIVLLLMTEKQEPKIVNDVARTEEPQQIVDQPRRYRREQIPPRKYEDHEYFSLEVREVRTQLNTQQDKILWKMN